MEKIFIFCLLFGSSLFLTPTEYHLKDDNSQCVNIHPTKPEDCFSAETEFFRQTCCYFEGKYQDVDGQYVTGPACLEANLSDVSTGARKFETQKKIEAGTYWKDYPPITNIQSFKCFDTYSECKKRQPVSDPNECFSSKPELTTQSCCYLESDWKTADKHEAEVVGSCVDIYLTDSATEEKIEETKKKIMSGTYWKNNAGYATKINKLVCESTNLKLGYFMIFLTLILL